MKAIFLDQTTLGHDIDLSPITKQFKICKHYESTLNDEVYDRVKNFQVIYTNKVSLKNEHLKILPDLKFIGVLATGTNILDLDFAKKLNITVCNVSDYATHSVAEHTFASILQLSHKLDLYQKDVYNGAWSRSKSFCLNHHPIWDLQNKKLVILGYGNIGKQVAQVAQAFGMEVILAQLPGRKKKESLEKHPRVDFLKALKIADILSIHCPLNSNTKDLLNSKTLSAMKRTAIIINTARGGIINESDLLHALQKNIIAGAALDVLEEEPPSLDHPLIRKQLPNLLLSPHCAWASKNSRQRLVNEMAKSTEEFLRSLK